MRQARQYQAIREAHEKNGYPESKCCEILHVSRAAYYRWLSGKPSLRQTENGQLAKQIEEIYQTVKKILPRTISEGGKE